ncbi:MAG: hypothetical protein HY735_05780 [Verrucomicrobia bacterium]|nr:hypothetical protein [Verrucomicrobiota bacterium]
MSLLDLSFIDEARALEVEAIDTGRGTSEFTLAPGPSNFDVDVGEGDEEALHGRPADDVFELGERLKNLPRYVDLARMAFQQRELTYPFQIDDSGQALVVSSGQKQLALRVADLSRVIRQGNPEASKFEKRAFRALQRLIGGWGVCVGSPRETEGIGAEKAIREYRSRLLGHERGSLWPADFSPNGDHGADGFLIVGRGWGGPIAFYQSKNTGFDLESHPEEFSRIPAIAEDWFGKKVNLGRRVIPVLALNTILSIELKEKIYAERGEHGVHIIDAVDVLAAEHIAPTHATLRPECIVL